MFSRTMRALTARAASLVPPMRSTAFLSSPASTRMFTDTTDAATDATTTTTAPPGVASTPPRSTPRVKLPYFVARNKLGNLGVYQRNKRGGNHLLTLVKNGEGDLVAMKHDIRDALNINDKDIFVQNTTKHIVIKGHKRGEVVNFLLASGF